jgi:sulfite exporter TauE/SafE
VVEQVRHLTEGIALGLATGHICLATCGPVYATFLMEKQRTFARQVVTVLELSLGRFITYLLVGAIAGMFGRQVSELQREYFTFAAYLLFSGYLIVSAVRSKRCEGGCAVGRWSRFSEWPIVLGMLTGINICPSFLLAFTRSFELSGPVAGMFFFAAFFAGTSVFLIPLSFVGLLGYKRHFRTLARFAAVGVAAWFIGNAGVIGYNLAKPLFDKRPVITLLDDRPMYIILSDPGRAASFAARMAQYRTGPVFVADSVRQPTHSDRYYVVTEPKLLSDRTTGAPFRKKGVFVAIITDKYITGPDSLATVIDFLDNYRFRFNQKTGDAFNVR